MTKKIIVLDSGTFYGYPSVKESMEDLGDVVVYEHTEQTDVKQRIADAEIVVTNKVVLDRETILSAKNLKLICVTATGTNNIDFLTANEKGILVKNAKDYSTDSVAQATLGMVLHLLMNFNAHHNFVSHNYSSHRFFTHLNPGFSELKGKTWGIIGLGNIGKKVAEIAAVFGCKVIYHSPSGRVQAVNYEHKNLNELLSLSDIITIHTPLNKHSENLITFNRLKLCKRNLILINVARGGIVNEYDLAEALNKNLIQCAGIDVFSKEPVSPENPLLKINNPEKLLLAPHIAWGSYEARKTLMDITRENIITYLKTGK